MAYEIIEQVKELFGDQEQYYSFLDIANQRNIIRDAWWRKFWQEMNKTVSTVDKWGYSATNLFDYRWYINELGTDSFGLYAGNVWNKFSIGFWAPQNKYDIKKLSELLQESKYGEPIKEKFNRLDYIGNESTEWKYVEHIVFEGSNENEVYDLERLGWYANYKTPELVSQVISKIDVFRKDSEIKDILLELNKKTLLEEKL